MVISMYVIIVIRRVITFRINLMMTDRVLGMIYFDLIVLID